MTTMEEVIAQEVKAIIDQTRGSEHWTNRMVEIQRRAENILKTLEEGDPI